MSSRHRATLEFRFLLDELVHHKVVPGLAARGIDAVHAARVGLAGSPDPDILDYAISEDRIVITRNYQDFVPLASSYSTQGRFFPGILFLPTSIRHSDVGGHIGAVAAWLELARARQASVASSCGRLVRIS